MLRGGVTNCQDRQAPIRGNTRAMLRVTKDIKLPTTITGSLPRPSWFTENLGERDFMFAMVDSTYREQYLDAVSVYLKRTGAGRPRHRHRRRCAFRQRRRRTKLDQLSDPPHGRLQSRPEADVGRQRRACVSAGAHPARLSRSARDVRHRRPGRPRRPAICSDVESRAAHDQEAGQVRHHRAGARRLRRHRLAL